MTAERIKPIELSLRKWAGADLVQAVLGGDDKKRCGRMAGRPHSPGRRHRPRRRLGAGTGTVDFVASSAWVNKGQAENEVRLTLIEEVEAGEIWSRSLVSSAERQADSLASLARRGLAGAGVSSINKCPWAADS